MKQSDLKHAQVAQAEKDYDQACDEIHSCLMCLEETAHCACQRSQRNKNQRKTSDESCGADERFSGIPFPAAGKIREINGKHGQ